MIDYHTAVPGIVLSDSGPQFTFKNFYDFVNWWGFECKASSPLTTQSNGKIEATVKSMKKIITSSWGNRSVLCAKHYCNILTGTHHHIKMGNLQLRNYSVDPCRTHYHHTATPLHLSGNAVPLKPNSWQNIF